MSRTRKASVQIDVKSESGTGEKQSGHIMAKEYEGNMIKERGNELRARSQTLY